MANSIRKLILFLFSVLFFSCSASKYDQYSYNEAVSLKAESLALMSKANENYTLHENDVNSLNSDLNKILSYEKKRSNNSETVQMYKLLTDPNGNLLGAFFKKWKSSGTMESVFITQFKTQVSDAFDSIIDLEKAKRN